MNKNGKSLREIARTLQKSVSTIQNVVKIYRDSGRIDKKLRNVNRAKLGQRHKTYLKRLIRKDPTVSGVSLAAELEKYFSIKVTPQTVRNYVKKLGFRSRTAVRKPYVSSVNRRKRVIFARQYLNKNMRFWKRVIFSYECKFNIKMSDGRIKIWRECNTSLQKRNLQPSFKHGGGSLMVWGCFGANGVGKLHFIDGIMTARQYIDILKKNLRKSAKKLGCKKKFIFQQDNDPKHTALDTRLWILYNCPNYLKTPPQSPDINPIENLWSIFKKQLKHHQIRNREHLKKVLKSEWKKISPNLTKKLVESMPKRLSAVLRQRGYPTKY